MKLRISKSFSTKLNLQIEYIARDKPLAARKFKTEIIKRIKEIPKMPFINKKSVFFDSKEIRDLIFKGYIVVYKIDEAKDTIEVFGFTKYEDDPFKL
ncbi:MAG: type II toxin-antitoxin system RelE/ParE family toxin [Bacteroidales bacterium]|nr:type II toxin-antitoxin system RelE/ParE family toxin [Bacteroidales bacterium]MCF8457182.1 type II toxin-antitoxin system RelE/ParE family toxin [Bacteroidales bacterium]